MATRSGGITISSVFDNMRGSFEGGARAATWSDEGLTHDGRGTMFLSVLAASSLQVASGTYPLPALGYAVVPCPARIDGGAGLAVVAPSHRGLFLVGGPVEATGRLRYIDGCSDTLLAAPVVRGDPCLNLLHVPAGSAQSHHRHPSVRVGLVVAGSGACISSRDRRHDLHAGSVFLLRPWTDHHFETRDHEELLVMAWHPDSDVGPTNDDHPMVNGTFRVDASPLVS